MRVPSFPAIALLVFLTGGKLIAQTDIFPELTGEALLEALVDEYKSQVLLSLTQAKDTLYSRVEAREDSVHGIYTDFTLYLPPGQDPSQALFMNGSGLNLEHSWPQSKGAGSGMPGRSDMHHLYPSRVIVNSSRASFPFGEINDSDTDNWYYRNIERTSIPTSQIELYSESIEGMFEPRESVKGNIARGMFYFYTMYKNDADNADPNFFTDQLATLCAWHYADPADENEIFRTQRIATYQGGKVNPFVLDCTLAERAYCTQGGPCGTVAASSLEDTNIEIRMTQSGCNINLNIIMESSAKMTNSIISSGGRVLYTRNTILPIGENTIEIDACDLPQGIYYLNSRYTSHGKTAMRTLKFAIASPP
jgi:endonuclease I